MIINKDSVDNAVTLLGTQYDGSRTNQFARYKAVTLLENYVKLLHKFVDVERETAYQNHSIVMCRISSLCIT
jgi:hypothetical protein